VSETHGAVADRMTQHVRHIGRSHFTGRRGLLLSGCGRAACGFFGLAFRADRCDQRGDSGVGLGRDDRSTGGRPS